MHLYKYCTLNNAKKMISDNSVYIGTLSEYRNQEKYGPDIGDKGEGSSTLFEHIDNFHSDEDELSTFTKSMISLGSSKANVNISDTMLTSSYNSPERFIYCMTDVFSVWLMRRLSQELKEHYNACVKITNPERFIKLVSDAIEDKGQFNAVSKCLYQRRYQDPSETVVDPAYIKEQKYDYQMEVRITWIPKKQTEHKGFAITINGLSDFCEILYVDEDWHDKKPICNGQTLKRDNVLLDFTRYENCQFKECWFRYAGFGGMCFKKCDFINIKGMELTNSAYRTIECLKNLHSGSNKQWKSMIQQYLDQFKNS